MDIDTPHHILVNPPYIPNELYEALAQQNFPLEVYLPWVFHEVTINGDWYTLHDQISNEVTEMIESNEAVVDNTHIVHDLFTRVVEIIKPWMDYRPMLSPLQTAYVLNVDTLDNNGGWLIEYIHDEVLIEQYRDHPNQYHQIRHIPKE